MKTSVFITNLEQYTNGRLVGQWVDLPFTDEQWSEIYKASRELTTGNWKMTGKFSKRYNDVRDNRTFKGTQF